MPKTSSINKHVLYSNAFYSTLDKYIIAYKERNKTKLNPLTIKLIISGVKTINNKPEPDYIEKKSIESYFQISNILTALMGSLTPKEFTNLFPINKEYDGYKYNTKDYFYTRDYIKTLDQDKPIGSEISNLLWEYHNRELTAFSIKTFRYINYLRRFEGKPSLMREFGNMMGLKTYSIHTDQRGTKFVIDNETKKTTKVINRKSMHLKIIK